MSREETMSRVLADVAARNLGRARDRLHGLLASYPNDLALRTHLAEIYSRLRQPAMAGRYWYLDEPGTDEMRAARAAFERECGGSAERMLQRLRFRGDVKTLGDSYAGQSLRLLQMRACDEAPVATRARTIPGPTPVSGSEWKSQISMYGCLAVVVGTLLLIVLGLIFVAAKFL